MVKNCNFLCQSSLIKSSLTHLWHFYEDFPLPCLANFDNQKHFSTLRTNKNLPNTAVFWEKPSFSCQRCVKATLTLLLIYFRGIIRVIMKIEVREIKFSWGVIAWDFLLIFYFSKIERKWLAKNSFSAKNQKDMLYDGTPKV